MKRLVWFALILSVAVVPAWATKKVTVQELKELLISLQESRKGDGDIATALKEVELSEELTPDAKTSLAEFCPGPHSSEELAILEGRSAILAPPASELPLMPAPDKATQRAILAKTVNYVLKTYMQNPHLTVSRTTSRYQDGVESIRTNSGMANNVYNATPSWQSPNIFMRLLGTHTESIESDGGVEKVRATKDTAPWSQNGQISAGGPGPVLSVILQDAASGGRLDWLRWEAVNGKPTAVFAFDVDKNTSHYEVNYCCFPVTSDTGRYGYEDVEPNMQTATDWKAFKAIVPYRGEFFIDSDTGTIVRLVTQAELKPTDFVHQEDMRIDFGPVSVGGKSYELPIDSFTITEVVPNGDNYAARYSVRHTLFTVTYRDYRLAGRP
ncbi:MAG: hypothetical protein ACLPY1_18315 [Terracidiphilus sp.]